MYNNIESVENEIIVSNQRIINIKDYKSSNIRPFLF